MYVRPPNNNHSELKLPENYSGNAFSRFSAYADMPPPVKAPLLKNEPRIGEESTTPHETFEAPHEKSQEVVALVRKQADNDGEKNESTGGSLLSSLLPNFDLSKHFPFGHGIGGEELLILAIMLIVFVSGNDRGEVDSELLLLLGLLLFAG